MAVAFVCVYFPSPTPTPPPPRTLKRTAERKRACPPWWSTEKETLFDVSRFLGLNSRPVLVPSQGLARRYPSGNSTDPCPVRLGLFSLEDLTGCRLSSSNLATGFFVARNRWVKETRCNRLMPTWPPSKGKSHGPSQQPRPIRTVLIECVCLSELINHACQQWEWPLWFKQWLHPPGFKNPLPWKPT